jgi:hypothetical protein
VKGDVSLEETLRNESGSFELCSYDSPYEPCNHCCEPCVGNFLDNTVVFAGGTSEAPLSDWFSLYGNAVYAVPGASARLRGSGEEQFAIQFGLAYYFGGKAASPSVTGQKGLPLLDVASNGSFLITD